MKTSKTISSKIRVEKCLTLWALASGLLREFSHQNNRIARSSHERNSGAESGRELFKGLKDAASLLVCT